MIYANKTFSADKREFEFGTIHQVLLGEIGRGRKGIPFTCPENTILKPGINDDYSIGLTKSGKPRIIKQKDKRIFLFIDSYGGYSRRGDGWVDCLKTQEKLINPIAIGNGADGAAGRIGDWDCICLEVFLSSEEPIIIRVHYSGGVEESDLIVITKDQVYTAKTSTIVDSAEVNRIELPCTIKYEEGEAFLKNDEWKHVRDVFQKC